MGRWSTSPEPNQEDVVPVRPIKHALKEMMELFDEMVTRKRRGILQRAHLHEVLRVDSASCTSLRARIVQAARGEQ